MREAYRLALFAMDDDVPRYFHDRDILKASIILARKIQIEKPGIAYMEIRGVDGKVCWAWVRG